MWTFNFNNMAGERVGIAIINLNNCTIAGDFPVGVESGQCVTRQVMAVPGFEQASLAMALEYSTGILTVRLNFEGNATTLEIEQWQKIEGEDERPALFANLTTDNVLSIYEVFNPQPNPLPRLWNSSRAATSPELRDLEYYLPKDVFWDSPIRVYDEPGHSYNCFSWAMGITDGVIDPAVLLTVQSIAGLLGTNALLLSDMQDDSANVLCWGVGTTVVHLSVLRQFPEGLSWSSKLGYTTNAADSVAGMLVSHSRNGFVATNGLSSRYGALIAAFRVGQWPSQ